MSLGLVAYGVSVGLIVHADLGLDPWDVLHQGLSRVAGIRLGVTVIAVSVVVLLIWIPLRLRPGLGTVMNAVLVGATFEVVDPILPDPTGLPARIVLLAAGIGLNAVATAAYIGAGLGPGPRDGLMVGIARRIGSIRTVRTTIELVVLASGWLLGGSVGIGTVAYGLAIGPLVHPLLPLVSIDDRHRRRQERLDPVSARPG